jgi:hypothetical protein
MRNVARGILVLFTLAGCAHGEPPAAGAATAPAASAGGFKAAGTNRVFRGPEGQRASVVYLAPVDDGQVLVRFDGTGSVWDGKIFLHKLNAYNDKEDYVMQWNGHDYVTITMRSGWGGYHQYEIYPPNRQDSLVVEYSLADSQKLDAAQLITEYARQGAKK